MTDSYVSEDLVTTKWCPLTPEDKCIQTQCAWWDEASQKCAVAALPGIRDATLVLVGQAQAIAVAYEHWAQMGIDVNQT